MASDQQQANNESMRTQPPGEEEQQPHSRVGGHGIPETLGNSADKAATTKQNQKSSTPSSSSLVQPSRSLRIHGGPCRYVSGGMSFAEVCQFPLQQLCSLLLPTHKSYLCEGSIKLTAEFLANDVIRYLLKEDINLISKDPISRSMCHNVYQMLNKHSILFTSMVNRLNVVPDTAYEAFVCVAGELFYEGTTWAQIVCLYAFMGRLALWANDRKMHHLVKKLPLYVARYISEEIGCFIEDCGGWEELSIEYPVAEEVSGSIWKSLLVTGATLGLVATVLSVTS